MPTSTFSEDLFLAALKIGLPPVLPQFLLMQRWFGGKARTIRAVEASDIVPFHSGAVRAYLILAQVEYASSPGQVYHVPLVRVGDGPSHPSVSSLLRIQSETFPDEIVLKDALTDEQFLVGLLDAIAEGVSLPGARGLVRAVSTPALQPIWRPSQGPLTPFVMKAEQSNSSVVYGNRLVLKIYRHVEDGLNPDLEIGSFLTGKTPFRN